MYCMYSVRINVRWRRRCAGTCTVNSAGSQVWFVFLYCVSQHTHTHTFNDPLSRSTRVTRYQKGKTNLDFTEARDSERQWHQLGHMQVCNSLQTDNHAGTPPLKFFTGRMLFLPPNQQRQSTEGNCVSQLFNNFLLRFRWGFTRGLCCRGLPVCPSVCLSQAGVVSKQIGGSSWFLACRLFIIHTLLYGNGQVSLKIRLLLSGTLSQGLRKFRNGKSIVVSTKLVDGRACISHLRRRTRRCWTHIVYYTSVDVMPWLFYFDFWTTLDLNEERDD